MTGLDRALEGHEGSVPRGAGSLPERDDDRAGLEAFAAGHLGVALATSVADAETRCTTVAALLSLLGSTELADQPLRYAMARLLEVPCRQCARAIQWDPDHPAGWRHVAGGLEHCRFDDVAQARPDLLDRLDACHDAGRAARHAAHRCDDAGRRAQVEAEATRAESLGERLRAALVATP